MNKQNDEPSTDNHDLLKESAKYFKELLNDMNEERPEEISPAATDLEIRTDNFMLNEIRVAIHKMSGAGWRRFCSRVD